MTKFYSSLPLHDIPLVVHLESVVQNNNVKHISSNVAKFNCREMITLRYIHILKFMQLAQVFLKNYFMTRTFYATI